MSARLRRSPAVVRDSLHRMSAGAVSLLALIVAWRLLRGPLLYSLACASLGDYRRSVLIDRAIIERHPEIPWQRDERGSGYGSTIESYRSSTWSGARAVFDAPRRSLVESSRWLLVDERLNTVASFCDIELRPSFGIGPADRDGDGRIELLFFGNTTRGSNSALVVPRGSNPALYWCVVRLGADRHALVAVVTMSAPIAPNAAYPWPVWTDTQRDGIYELEWLDITWSASRATSAKSMLKLRWLRPGRMTLDGPLPPGFKLWLADDQNEVTFTPEEPLDDVVRRVLEQQR